MDLVNPGQGASTACRPQAHAAGRALDRRRLIRLAGLGGAVLLAGSSSSFATGEDERLMRMAIEEARRADSPFGAVIVQHGRVLARGRNLTRTDGDPTAHGEMVAIRRGLARRGRQALEGATLYTSGEPCAMCMGAILWVGIGRLVFAASLQQLASKIDQIMISSADIAAKTSFARISITGGVLADAALELFNK